MRLPPNWGSKRRWFASGSNWDVEGKMFDNADELVKGDGFDEVGLVPNNQY